MKMPADFFQKLRRILLNKYAIVTVVFIVFLMFSGNNSLINRFKRAREINSLEKEVKFYRSEINENKKKMQEMRSGKGNLEKYAREQYYLKKDSEDVYIIKEDDDEKK